MLIDVREIKEYKISHLQTAANVKTAEEIAQLRLAIAQQELLLVYKEWVMKSLKPSALNL